MQADLGAVHPIAARAVRTKAMPLRPRAFPELLVPEPVRELFLESFSVGAARTRVERHMTSMAEITMAISRNTTDFIKRTKFAQEKNG